MTESELQREADRIKNDPLLKRICQSLVDLDERVKQLELDRDRVKKTAEALEDLLGSEALTQLAREQ